MRLIVEIDRTPDGRIEGRIRPDAAQPWRPFSGVLELLKELQDVLDVRTSGRPGPSPDRANPTR